MCPVPYPIELKLKAIELFKQEPVLRDVARKLTINDKTVQRWTRAVGLIVDKKYSFEYRERNKPNNNKEIFPTDNKVLGYICGFIATDGCLKRKNNIISICNLRKESLDWILSQISENKKVLFYKKQIKPVWEICLSFPKLYKYCLDMGMTPNKSLTLNVNLDDKSDEFKWYFLRGVIDGDGYVTDRSIGIASSSKEFVLTLQKWFGGRIYNKNNRLHPHFALEFTKTLSKQLLQYLPIESHMFDYKNERLLKLKAHNKFLSQGHILVGKLWGNDHLYPVGAFNVYKYAYNLQSTDISYRVFLARIRAGWDINEALTQELCINQFDHVNLAAAL